MGSQSSRKAAGASNSVDEETSMNANTTIKISSSVNFNFSRDIKDDTSSITTTFAGSSIKSPTSFLSLPRELRHNILLLTPHFRNRELSIASFNEYAEYVRKWAGDEAGGS
jgi:hypothetical protein